MVEFFVESKDSNVVIEEAKKIVSEIFKEEDAKKSDKLIRLMLDNFLEIFRYTRTEFRHWHRGGDAGKAREWLRYSTECFVNANNKSINLKEKFAEIGRGF